MTNIVVDTKEFSRSLISISAFISDSGPNYAWLSRKNQDDNVTLSARGSNVAVSFNLYDTTLPMATDIAICYDRLIKIIGSFKDEKTTIRIKDNWAFFTCGNIKTRVPSSGSVMPDITPGEKKVRIENGALLISAIKAAGTSLDKKDTANFAFTNVHFQMAGDRLIIESADGSSLMRCTVPATPIHNDAQTLNICLERRQIDLLSRVIGQERPLDICMINNLVELRTEDGLIQLPTSLLKFPDVSIIIPNKPQVHQISVNRKLLVDALQRANYFNFNGAITVNFAEMIKIKVDGGQLGLLEEDIPYTFTGKTGPDVIIKILPKQLIQALNACIEDTVDIGLDNSVSRITFKATSKNGLSFIFVTMPVRT